MQLGAARIALAIMWVVIAFGIYYREWLAPAEWGDSKNLDLAAVMALAFAVWNIVRFFALRQRQLPQEPPIPIHPGERKDEYLPEFDFTRANSPEASTSSLSPTSSEDKSDGRG